MSFANRFDKHPRRSRQLLAHTAGVLAIAFSGALAACEGCKSVPAADAGPASAAVDVTRPTLRLYLVSDLSGALEPCGCTKDQLGGIDHAAAWMRAEGKDAPNAALVSAGPLFFMEPTLKGDHADQDSAKAETIAAAMKTLGFAAFAPGVNDWAGGPGELAKLERASGAALLYANATPSPEGVPAIDAGVDEAGVPIAVDAGEPPVLGQWVVRDVGGVKVGLIGVSQAGEQSASLGIRTTPAPDAIKAGLDALKKQGAQVFVALAAVGRGDAKRLADLVPSLTAVVVGSPGGSGDLNTPAPPAERIGDVLILQTGNHLTSVGALDLFVRGGSYTFADATGLELGQKREELRRRVDELHVKIATWERDANVKKEDLDARKAEVTKLESDLAGMATRPPPTSGSFFHYQAKEVRDSLGTDPQVKGAIGDYYKWVNDHNRVTLANRLPPPHTPSQPVYIGTDACSGCHKEPREVWNGTRHSHAYKTLSDQNKEFNLDCVSCHVTGYELPGGSTVTHVSHLQDVGCEDCHGPGSKHALDPKRVHTLVPKPKGDKCLGCHHPPHVEGFDAEAKMAEILGPGHGL